MKKRSRLLLACLCLLFLKVPSRAASRPALLEADFAPPIPTPQNLRNSRGVLTDSTGAMIGILEGSSPGPQNTYTGSLGVLQDGSGAVVLNCTSCGGATSSPGTLIKVSPSCGLAAHCFPVNADGQVAMTAAYQGTTGTLVTSNDNDATAQYAVVGGVQPYLSWFQLNQSRTYTSITSAFKPTGTPGTPNCWGTNEAAGSSGTVTVAITPAGGAGTLLIAYARAQNSGVAITFSDGTNLYTNALASSSSGATASQMAYVINDTGGSYTLTATFGSNSTNRSIFACEVSATAWAFDTAVAQNNTGSVSNLYGGQITTAQAGEYLFQAGTVASSTGTFTAEYVNGATVTTQTSDPVFAAGDVGKKVLATTVCDGPNGYQDCYTSLPAGTTVAAYVGPHSVILSKAFTQQNSTTASNFTGWFLWGTDDYSQIHAAWTAALAANNATLQLPCGMMFLTAPPFLSSAAGDLFNPNIEGCAGPNGTILVPTDDYNFGAASGGIFYSYAATNLTGFSNVVQTPFYWSRLSNFTVWGGGIDGSTVTTALPIMNLYLARLDNVWVVGWNWRANTTANAEPVMAAHSIDCDNCGGWAASTGGLQVIANQSPALINNVARDCFFGAQAQSAGTIVNGSGLIMQGGYLESYNCQFNPGKAASSTGPGASVTGGVWNSYGDQIGLISVTNSAALVTLHGSTDSILQVKGVTISAGTVNALNSQIDALTLSSTGIFNDLGGNFYCTVNSNSPCTGGRQGSWTKNPGNSITGGTVVGTGSVTGTAFAASNVNTTTGWGVAGGAGSGVSAPGGFSKKVQFTITATGTPAASPAFTVTYPVQFATTPVCSLQQIGGTFGDVSSPVSSAGSATVITWTFTGTPLAAHAYTFVQSCDL